MGQESEGYLSNSCQRLLRATVKVLARIVVSSKGFVEGVLASKLTCAAVGRIQFLGNHWPEGLISSLAVGWRPPLSSLSYSLFHWAHNLAGDFSQGEQRRESKRKLTRWKPELNLESDIPSL